MRTAVLGILSLLAVIPASALGQSVAPPLVEYTGSTDGGFDISNNSLRTMYATVEVKSFVIDPDGRAHFRPLDPSIHVELSTTSMRIPPQQKRRVYYRATADSFPAWFCIYTDLSSAPARTGMTTELELPHTVYLLGKRKPNKADLEVTDLKVVSGELRGTFVNRGTNVMRVLDLHMNSGKSKREAQGFPILPGAERRFEIPLAGAEPRSLSAHLARFDATFPVAPRSTP